MTWGKQSFVAVAVVGLALGAVARAQQQQDQAPVRSDQTGQRDQAGQDQQGASDQARQAGQSSRRGQGDQQGRGQAGQSQPADRQIEQILTKIAEDPTRPPTS